MSSGVSALSEDSPGEIFGISAVSRLTGISPHVLRIWERRYRVVEPKRSDTKRREYDREDVRRLSLVKALVDHGHSIRHVASQPTSHLENLLGEIVEIPEAEASAPKGSEPTVNLSEARIAFVGSLVRDSLREACDQDKGLRIVAEAETLSTLLDSAQPSSVDVLVVEIPTLFEKEITEVQNAVEALSARRAIVIYRFAKSGVVDPLDKDLRMVTAMRAPINASELRLACAADLVEPDREDEERRADRARESIARAADDETEAIPERQFSDNDLARISRLSSVVDCECPQHLATLLSSLSAFEAYSAACESQNEDDARLHAFLHKTTADCRAEMEAALLHLMDVEKISLRELD